MFMGSGCGTVDSTVTSDTRGPVFESIHRQFLINIFLLNVCRKNENKEKEAGKASFRKKNVENVRTIFRAWELPFRVFNALVKSNNVALNACLKS